MSDQQRFAGMPVMQFEGRYAGSFEMAEEDADDLIYGDLVTFVVTAAVGDAKYSTNKIGDLKRQDAFELEKVVVLSPEAAKQIQDLVDGWGSNGQLNMEAYEPAPEYESITAEDRALLDDVSRSEVDEVGQVPSTSDRVLKDFLTAVTD